MHRGWGQAGRRGWQGGHVRLLPVPVLLLDLHVSESQGPQCGYRMSRSLYVPMYLLDCTLFFVTPLLVATVLYGSSGESCSGARCPTRPTLGLGAARPGSSRNPREAAPGARWGPQVLQEAGG